MTLPVRRLAAALVLGVALVTAGCGNTEANRAAVVDGRVIQETTVQQTMSQINSANPVLASPRLTPSVTLTYLIQAPVVLDYLAGKGVVASESVARHTAAQHGITDPGPGTLEVLRFAAALNSSQMTQAENIEVSDTLKKLGVVVNPRYGSFDPATATVSVSLPSWVTAYNASK